MYCPEPCESAPLYPAFNFKYPAKASAGGLFKERVPPNFFERDARLVPLAEARAVVLPNNFLHATADAWQYITRYADMAEGRGIPLFVFSCGDFTDKLAFDPRAYIFRTSLYGAAKGPRDISIPTLTEDLGAGGIVLRPKHKLPTVSFCGQAGYQSGKQRAKYYVKVFLYLAAAAFKPSLRARTIGVYWRRKALAACRRSTLVRSLFIIRNSFSGARRTIELDPAQARKEFTDSIRNADFVLAPKGDGNYSNRFLEALSMGRIPVLIDTDMVLTLEDHIDYAKIMVRVPMNRVGDTAKYIRDFYDPLTDEEWQARQRLARETFEKYLRQDSFFTYFFNTI